MGQPGHDLRAMLQGQINEIVEALLAEKSEPDRITLSEIEQLVAAAGEKLKAALTGGLVQQASEEDRSAAGPVCATCGQAMHYKGQKEKYVATETGGVRVKRAYYYCDTCRAGVFPPGSAVGTGQEPV
jgi:hypothetical protein